MLRYSASRLLQALLVLVATSVVVFLMLRALPGDPAIAMAGVDARPEVIAAIRHDLALDAPLHVQYATWITHAVRGDFGRSISARRPVGDLVQRALPASIQLGLAALCVAIVFGGTLGIVAAVNRGKWPDTLVGGLGALLISVPSFWSGLLAIIVFALTLMWLPPGGRVDPTENVKLAVQSLILPALVLGMAQGAVISRFTRAAMLEVLSESYVRTAHSKGLPGWRVTLRHALPNALIPVVTVIGIQIGHLIGGAVVVETVFSWPGMGRLMVTAISGRDYPVVQGVMLLLVAGFVFVNLVVDLLYGILDPRIRLTH
jgi:peptide/nickel transport system permease protein